ncbi:MAG: chorismate mutase [Nanoarchaeota archaeon]|nr:chorismate mutase [Nanoarchaeota archaeon]
MNKLRYYRTKIDSIDRNIVKLLLFRFKIVKQIAHYKKINKINAIDKKRELEVVNNIKKYSNKSNQKFIIKIFKKVINYSKRLQSK